MSIVFFILFLTYVVYVVVCINKNVQRHVTACAANIALAEKGFQERSLRKDQLQKDKIVLEAEALKIYTLYELTREITKTFNPEDAFKILRTSLEEHIHFKECRLVEAESEEIVSFKRKDDHFVFTLKDKKKIIGHLLMTDVSEKDREIVSILGNQYVLALRRVNLYAEIERIAITDNLTETYTRRYALERFQEEVKRSQSRKLKLSFLMIDVDHFKKFNDTYGHLTGDKILRGIAEIIKGSIREIDIAGRFGGEEFCVVLPDTDREGARFAAERIRQAAERATIKAYDANVQVTLSVGVATFPDDGKSSGELIEKADQALYRAKKLGRNQVCFF